MKKDIYNAHSYKNGAEVAILIRDKIDFKIKIATNNKGHFSMIRHQKYFIIYIYKQVPKFMKQKLTELKGQRNNSTIVGDTEDLPTQ